MVLTGLSKQLEFAVLISPKEAIVQPIVAGRCDGDMIFLANDCTLPLQIGVALHYGHYEITVDASAQSAGLNYAIRSLTKGGICTSVGYYFQSCTALPLMQMYVRLV